MKKLLLLSVSLLLVVSMAFSFSGCKKKNKGGATAETYSLDTTGFNSVAVFEEELSLDGLKLIGSNGDVVNVTSDMVSRINTGSAGEKSFTVTYKGQTFKVNYTVKFRVIFVINDVETTQYVTSADQLSIPETPKIPGKQFDCWSETIPNVLVSNMRITALYKTLTSEREDVQTWSGEGLINLEGYANSGANVSVIITDKDGNALPSSVATLDKTTNKIRYNLGSYDSFIIAIDGDVNVPKSWSVTRTEKPTLTMGDGSEAVGLVLGGKSIAVKINAASSKVKLNYNTAFDNANVDAVASGGFLMITAYAAGVSKLTVNAVNKTNELEYITLTQYVVVAPEIFTVKNDETEYGIEDIWTIGGVNADGLTKLYVSTSEAGAGFYENISFVSNDERVGVAKNGTISVHSTSADPGMIEFRAVLSYKGVEFKSLPMQVRCVFNGVNVYNYAELWSETSGANSRPIVLQSNVRDFAPNYTEMRSTYDLTYYENAYGKDSVAYNTATTIKVLIQFRNNVYGNGYEINAHNATIGMLDSTGKLTSDTLFRGPINFVAASSGGSSAISVKGQDNIVFGVYDNVTLNNVILKSCDDQTDLAYLNYAGTTVEVLGDNVTIEYSRLMNGRTVLRVFGDEIDSEKPIHVTVKNSSLRASREFIARIGSNRFYQTAAASPYLPGDEKGTGLASGKNYNNLSAEQKADYDSKYINTFVTFKNTVFEDAGIFAIGLDTHFAGNLLHNGEDSTSGFANLLTNWKNLAKTSYGAKITLDTDVRFYNWKPLADVDSSTLIESVIMNNESLPNIKFDIRTAISKYDYRSDVIYRYDNKEYVHAGIAIFGGGKNYGVVETALTGTFNFHLDTIEIALNQVGNAYLEKAAGDQKFRFMLYSSKNTFNYEEQIKLQNKYSCLYDKG